MGRLSWLFGASYMQSHVSLEEGGKERSDMHTENVAMWKGTKRFGDACLQDWNDAAVNQRILAATSNHWKRQDKDSLHELLEEVKL